MERNHVPPADREPQHHGLVLACHLGLERRVHQPVHSQLPGQRVDDVDVERVHAAGDGYQQRVRHRDHSRLPDWLWHHLPGGGRCQLQQRLRARLQHRHQPAGVVVGAHGSVASASAAPSARPASPEPSAATRPAASHTASAARPASPTQPAAALSRRAGLGDDPAVAVRHRPIHPELSLAHCCSRRCPCSRRLAGECHGG